jgi:hypothetical protein
MKRIDVRLSRQSHAGWERYVLLTGVPRAVLLDMVGPLLSQPAYRAWLDSARDHPVAQQLLLTARRVDFERRRRAPGARPPTTYRFDARVSEDAYEGLHGISGDWGVSLSAYLEACGLLAEELDIADSLPTLPDFVQQAIASAAAVAADRRRNR